MDLDQEDSQHPLHANMDHHEHQSFPNTKLNPDDYDSQLMDPFGTDMLPAHLLEPSQRQRSQSASLPPSTEQARMSGTNLSRSPVNAPTIAVFGEAGKSAFVHDEPATFNHPQQQVPTLSFTSSGPSGSLDSHPVRTMVPSPPITQTSFSRLPEQKIEGLGVRNASEVLNKVDSQGNATDSAASTQENVATPPDSIILAVDPPPHGSPMSNGPASRLPPSAPSNYQSLFGGPAPLKYRSLFGGSALKLPASVPALQRSSSRTNSETNMVAADVVTVFNIDDDSDSEVVFVEESSCSQAARSKFAQYRAKKLQGDDELTYVKTEPKDHDDIEITGWSNGKKGNAEENAQAQAKKTHQKKLPTTDGFLLKAMKRRKQQMIDADSSTNSSSTSNSKGFMNQSAKLIPNSKSQGATAARERLVKAHDTDGGSSNLLDNVFNEKAELDKLMKTGRENDDNTWMEDDEDDDDADVEPKELVLLRKKRSSLLAKKKKGKQTWTESNQYEFLRITGQIENLQQRQRLADRRVARGESFENQMFVSDGEPDRSDDGIDDDDNSRARQHQYQMVEDERLARAAQDSYDREARGEREQAPEKSSRKKGGKRRKTAKNAREFEIRERERAEGKRRKEQGKAHKKQLRDAGPSGGEPSSDGKRRGKSSKTSGTDKNGKGKLFKSRMRQRWTKDDDTLQTVLDDLLNNDFIADRAKQKDYGVAPAINERTKEKQLQALLASVPETYDIHRVRTEKQDIHRASKRFGYGQVKVMNGKWLLKGMKSCLYHHQLLAADWMVGRELASRKPYGGLLADAMGLGKTLEMLATMVGNPPTQGLLKRGIKTTLLVLPGSAIRQWLDEIRTHCDEKVFKKILHWKASKDLPMEILDDVDVVVTSYAEVMNSYPFPTPEELKRIVRGDGFAAWMESVKESQGDLHKKQWYRVVLDEAHAIKNYRTRTSQACQALKAKYRWAMSGTPIQNRLEEMYSYFRFLKAEWTESFDAFKRHFCDPDADDSNARLRVVNSIIMMRRTMKDELLGRPLVELPKIHAETKYLKFSREERVIYRVLENRFRENMNRHFANRTAEKNYATFLVQLLRLRQCTSHPFLLESTVKQLLNLEDIQHLKRQLRQLGRNKRPMYEQIELWVQEGQEEREAGADGKPTPESGEAMPFGQSEFGTYFKMDKFLNGLNDKELMERVVCKICGDLPRDAQITDCNHIFCEECLREYMHIEAAKNEESDYTECPSCRKVFSEANPYKELQLLDDDEGDDASQTSLRSQKKKKSSSNPYKGPSKWLKMCTSDPQKYLLPSTKTVAFKSQVLKWVQEAPNDKIIVFVQFRMEARILGLICEAEKWEKVYFTGDMNAVQRHEAVQEFHRNPSIRIMIAGLKVGGQALNLTCANRVISTSLWFNHCVEQQAVGRVFRIGQHKETWVRRFVVRDTVDERLLDMQADKVKTIDRAMQDSDAGRVEPLSMEDLASLFGHLRRDDDGTLHVEADYKVADEDEDEGEGGDENIIELSDGDEV